MEEDGDNSNEHRNSHSGAEVNDSKMFDPIGDGRSEIEIGSDVVADSVVTWEASEFINHQKTKGWYLALTGLAVLTGIVVYLLSGDVLSLIVIVVLYVAIMVYARREPRILRYSVSSSGLSIGKKHFDHDQFKSFSALKESGVPSIMLIPTHRFMPAVSIYFAPEDANKIIGELSKFVPNEQRDMGPVDRAMLKLRF